MAKLKQSGLFCKRGFRTGQNDITHFRAGNSFHVTVDQVPIEYMYK